VEIAEPRLPWTPPRRLDPGKALSRDIGACLFLALLHTHTHTRRKCQSTKKKKKKKKKKTGLGEFGGCIGPNLGAEKGRAKAAATTTLAIDHPIQAYLVLCRVLAARLHWLL
jgi:hypothetical protein